jgi:hypothetical protein
MQHWCNGHIQGELGVVALAQCHFVHHKFNTDCCSFECAFGLSQSVVVMLWTIAQLNISLL